VARFTRINHQFSLFGFNAMRPKVKVPISAKKIQEAKDLMYGGDMKGAAERMRDVREALEAYEERLTNNPKR
jgi:hypothetical protein